MTKAAGQRIVWVDYARAIGILLVVAGHANRAVERSGLDWSAGAQLADGLIYSFHMPLFFVLAGFVSGLKRETRLDAFARQTFWGIVMPYLVWSAIWIGLKASLPGVVNVPIGLDALLSIAWSPVEHFWFLYHLFFIRILWFFVGRAGNQTVDIAFFAALAVAGIAMKALGIGPEIVSGIFLNGAYYGFGMLVLPLLVAQVFGRAGVPATAIATVVWLGAAFLAIGGSGLAAVATAALAGSLMTAGLSLLLPEARGFLLRGFAFLGEASLAIYVMHLPFAAAARVVLQKAGLLNETTLIVFGTLAGTLLPALAYYVALRLVPTIGSLPLRLAGLGTATRSRYLA
ncbi:MAG: acyltransferase [Hyphomicrobiales bacterium]